MMKSGKLAVLGALAVMMTAGQANACWSNAEQEAAKVANLNMMMMVTALRCRKSSDDFLADYNRFVIRNNPMLGVQNAVVRNHFMRMNGAKAADRAMDQFVIGLANNYGAGHDRMSCGQLKDIARELASKNHDSNSLLSIAEANVERFPLPGGSCPVAIASK
jgi:hypothetical protein